MPTDADFAALWARWKEAQEHASKAHSFTAFVETRAAAYFAAETLLDALTGDPELRRLEQEYHNTNPERYTDLLEENLRAQQLIDRLVAMGLLHGPEEVRT